MGVALPPRSVPSESAQAITRRSMPCVAAMDWMTGTMVAANGMLSISALHTADSSQDDDDDGLDAAAADARDELRDELEHAGLLQSRDGDEQADEKQQRLVVHAAQHFLHAGAAVGAHGHEQRQRCDDHADGTRRSAWSARVSQAARPR